MLSPGTGLRVQARQLLRSVRITVSKGALLLSLFPGSVQVGGQTLLEDLKLVWKKKTPEPTLAEEAWLPLVAGRDFAAKGTP